MVNTEWPRVGMKCVIIDVVPNPDFPDYGGDVRKGDIHTVVRVHPSGSYLALRCDRTGGEHEDGEWSLTSRYRPLTSRTQEQDTAMFREIADSAGSPLVTLLDLLNASEEVCRVDDLAAQAREGAEE